MSQETPIILYVGDSETGQWLESMIAPSYVYSQSELLPALGIYASYMPDLVILDARTMPDLARQAYIHLRSIDAEQILIISDNIEDWEHPAEAQIQVLTSLSKTDLLTTIGDLIGTSFVIGEGVS
jgi:hypothetical protein